MSKLAQVLELLSKAPKAVQLARDLIGAFSKGPKWKRSDVPERVDVETLSSTYPSVRIDDGTGNVTWPGARKDGK